MELTTGYFPGKPATRKKLRARAAYDGHIPLNLDVKSLEQLRA
jgi:hypothetical protein